MLGTPTVLVSTNESPSWSEIRTQRPNHTHPFYPSGSGSSRLVHGLLPALISIVAIVALHSPVAVPCPQLASGGSLSHLPLVASVSVWHAVLCNSQTHTRNVEANLHPNPPLHVSSIAFFKLGDVGDRYVFVLGCVDAPQLLYRCPDAPGRVEPACLVFCAVLCEVTISTRRRSACIER
jgi:hypothetical protein